MQFDVSSHERKTKADWDVEPGSTSEKRQRVISPLKFSNIQKVSKKTLQQQRVPLQKVYKTAVSSVQSSLEVTLNGSSPESKKLGYVNVILIAVKEKLVRNYPGFQRLQRLKTCGA